MLYPAARLPAGTMYSIRNRKLSAGIFPKDVPAPFPAAFPDVGTLSTASGQVGPKWCHGDTSPVGGISFGR